MRLLTFYNLVLFSFFLIFFSSRSNLYANSLTPDTGNFSFKENIKRLNLSLEENSIETVTEELNSILYKQKGLGTRNLYSVSNYLMVYSDALAEDGRVKMSKLLIEKSKSISPDSYEPYFLLAKINALNESSNIKIIAEELLSGFWHYLKNSSHETLLGTMEIFTFATLLTFVLIFVILSLRYSGNVYFDIKRFLVSCNLKENLAISLSLLFLVSVFNIGGILAVFMFLPMLLFGYMKGFFKYCMVGYFIFMLILPLIINEIGKNIALSNSPVYYAVKDIANDTWTKRNLEVLENTKKMDAGNWVIDYSLGTIYKKMGNFDSAILNLENVLKLNVISHEVFINLANAYFGKNDYDKALIHYDRAKDMDENSFFAYLNSGRLLGERGDIEKASTEFDNLMKIDSKKAIYFMNLKDREFNYKSLDAKLEKSFKPDIYGLLEEKISVTSNFLWNSVFFGIGHVKYYAFLIFSILFTIVIHLASRGSDIFSSKCVSCGVTFIGKQNIVSHERTCNECLTVLNKDITMDSSKKKEVTDRVLQFMKVSKRLFIFFNTLLPGAGYLMFERYVFVFFSMFVSSIFLSGFILKVITLSLMNFGCFVFIGIGLLYYIIFNFIALRRALYLFRS